MVNPTVLPYRAGHFIVVIRSMKTYTFLPRGKWGYKNESGTDGSLSWGFLLHYEERAKLINQFCQKGRLDNFTQGLEGNSIRIRFI